MHPLTKKAYARYEAAVKAFFEREGIENLTTGHIKCPKCEVPFNDLGRCPKCNTRRESCDEPYCSSHGCDCCGNSLQQNLEHATGYNREHNEIYEYEICQDCAYYAEYGCLDDSQMDEIDH
jgi:hypothetical protein